MTRNISADLKAHLAGAVTTLATLWKVTRKDGVAKAFTDHSEAITFESVTYEASSGFLPTSVQEGDDLSVDNMDVEGLLSSAGITDEDIHAGRYDYAALEIKIVNYADLTQGAIAVKSGTLGELTTNANGQFVAEIRGLTQQMTQNMLRVFTPSCPFALGDSDCKVTLASFTTSSVSVTEVTDNRTFKASALNQADDFFLKGEVQWLTGNNADLNQEVKFFGSTQVTLALPMPYDIQVGDTFDIIQGCRKTFDDCKDIFNNLVNFGGFPHIPGEDQIVEHAGNFKKD